MQASVNGSGLKRAALLNDLSCFGACSLTVAAPILSAMGVEAVPLPTVLLSAHTGVEGGRVLRDLTEEMEQTMADWQAMGLRFDCICTGFFASARQLDLAGQFIRDFSAPDTLVLVDPVLGDNGRRFPCFDDAYQAALRRLCALADVITPNRTEAALLAGLSADAPAEALLEALPCENAVITGVCSGGAIGYRARLGSRTLALDTPLLPAALKGTGDVFAAAFCGALLEGSGWEQALERGADFCLRCAQATLDRLPAHWYGLAFEDVLAAERLRPLP